MRLSIWGFIWNLKLLFSNLEFCLETNQPNGQFRSWMLFKPTQVFLSCISVSSACRSLSEYTTRCSNNFNEGSSKTNFQSVCSTLKNIIKCVIWCKRILNIIIYTPWNFVQGGLIPEMIQVCDYDILIVLVELNTLI